MCEYEFGRHRQEHSPRASEGSRPYRLYHGSEAVLVAPEDEAIPLTRVVSVPRPHGADAGEQSLRQEVRQNPESVDLVVLTDAHGRRSIRRDVRDRDVDIRVVAPTYLFYILYDNNLISRTEFCEACADLLQSEGWTGYQTVQAAWEGIPIDCSDVVDSALLP